MRAWGQKGNDDGRFDNPEDISISSDGTIYVCDRNNNRIQCFDPNGNFLCKWGRYGTKDGEFNWPTGLAVISLSHGGDSINKMTYTRLVTESNALVSTSLKDLLSKINVCTETGTYMVSIPLEILSICVAYAGDKYLYVVDSGNNRIQVFNVNGLELSSSMINYRDAKSPVSSRDIKSPVSSSVAKSPISSRDIKSPISSEGARFICKWGRLGKGDGYFKHPLTCEIGNGVIYVTDTANSRIQVFDLNGKFIFKWGTLGKGDHQFYYPNNLVVGLGVPRRFMSEKLDDKLTGLTLDDKLTGLTLDDKLTGLTLDDKLTGLTLDNKLTRLTLGSELVYVSDYMNNRILCYHINLNASDLANANNLNASDLTNANNLNASDLTNSELCSNGFIDKVDVKLLHKWESKYPLNHSDIEKVGAIYVDVKDGYGHYKNDLSRIELVPNPLGEIYNDKYFSSCRTAKGIGLDRRSSFGLANGKPVLYITDTYAHRILVLDID